MTFIDDPKLEDIFRFFCRHLVSLMVSYRPRTSDNHVDEDNVYCMSGFIFSSRDRWFWITAGHALKQIDEPIEKGTIEIVGSSLVDCFASKPFVELPIPFDYHLSQRFYIHDEQVGLDFGLVALRPHYRDLLRANGIVPLAEENWNYSRNISFDQYIMLGLPDIYNDVSRTRQSRELLVSLSPTMVYLEQTDFQPQAELDYPRFIAKIPDNCSLDITGMSGGPIFGFSGQINDHYWIVAIQSSWLRESKIVFGCPISVFAPLAEKIIDTIADDLAV